MATTVKSTDFAELLAQMLDGSTQEKVNQSGERVFAALYGGKNEF
jgi:hypothetical protein